MSDEPKPAEVTEIDLGALIQDDKNANLGTKRGADALTDSVRKYKAGRSILVDKNGKIIAGNKTAKAAGESGIRRVVVVKTTGDELVAVQRTDMDLDDPQGEARQLALYDNRVAELDLLWDIDALKEIPAAVLDDLFSKSELIDMGADWFPVPTEAAEPQIDKAAELAEKWGVETGQLWALGDHLLYCGDSRRPDIFEVLMDQPASMVWTDPPYGVKYGEKLAADNPQHYVVRTIENDDLTPDQLRELLTAVYTNCARHSVPGASIYSACPAGDMLEVAISGFKGSGFDFHWQLVWVKDQLVLGRGDYHFRHENILYGWKGDAAHFFTESRKQDSVFEVPRPKRSEEHPTMKPIALIVEMIENSSRPGEIVLDPFVGSGSTLMACQFAHRRCRAIDKIPGFCAVTIQRWVDDTGGEPMLLESSTDASGSSIDQPADED